MEFSITLDTVKIRMVDCEELLVIFSFFLLVTPYKIAHSAMFPLSFYRLQKYSFRGCQSLKC